MFFKKCFIYMYISCISCTFWGKHIRLISKLLWSGGERKENICLPTTHYCSSILHHQQMEKDNIQENPLFLITMSLIIIFKCVLFDSQNIFILCWPLSWLSWTSCVSRGCLVGGKSWIRLNKNPVLHCTSCPAVCMHQSFCTKNS